MVGYKEADHPDGVGLQFWNLGPGSMRPSPVVGTAVVDTAKASSADAGVPVLFFRISYSGSAIPDQLFFE